VARTPAPHYIPDDESSASLSITIVLLALILMDMFRYGPDWTLGGMCVRAVVEPRLLFTDTVLPGVRSVGQYLIHLVYA
jgi:hypothetical protein